jgi:outer membrane murein-binding lipoprotein Lpp
MNLPQSLALAAATSLALAGCASTRPAAATHPASLQLAQSAETLDRSARLLASRADSEETPGFAVDAHELSRRAYDFRMAAASSNATESELQGEFDTLTRSYEAVRADVDRAGTTQARTDLGLVEDPYHDVARLMGTSNPPAPGT